MKSSKEKKGKEIKQGLKKEKDNISKKKLDEDKIIGKSINEKEITLQKKKLRKKQFIIIFIIFVVLLVLLSSIFLFFKFNKKIDNNVTEKDNIEEVKEEGTEEKTEIESNETTPTESTDQSSDTSVPSINISGISARKTGYNPLDSYISQILSSIISPNTSAINRLYAIYSYVKNNMVYDMFPPTDSGVYETLISYGYSSYDAQQMTLAYNAAKYKHGVCDNYAALIMILARASGIEVWQFGGASSSGTSHAWNIIYVNGEKYLIDANYGIFMKLFSSSGYTEQMDGRNYFNYFKTAAATVEEKKISWLFNAGYSDQRFYGNSRGTITQIATINRPMYPSPGTIYPAPISPLVNLEGSNNSFSATVSSGGIVIENFKEQSGSNQNYTFSWYPPEPGSYVFEIVAKSDGIFEGHFIIYANIS